ncbi:Protein tyrosine phosphatase type IVA 2 [Sorochytrium milnesiophthora]
MTAFRSSTDRMPPTSPLCRMYSLIDFHDLRFMVLDCPTDSSLPHVLKIFAAHNVTDVVRVCEPTYATDSLAAQGIQVLDLPFPDGGVAPQHVTNAFLQLVESRFGAPNAAVAKRLSSSSEDSFASSTSSSSLPASAAAASARNHPPTIAVHCVAGLGRAPMMVAIALIEYGFQPLQAIEYVRARRRGAFNTTQVKYIDAYRPSYFSRRSAGLLRFRSAGISPNKSALSIKEAVARLFQRRKPSAAPVPLR